MGIVHAAERGEEIFFFAVVFGVFVILFGEVDDFILCLSHGFVVESSDVFFEHYDVFVYSCFLVHGLDFSGEASGT
jgi:hypothetical protein